MNEIVKATLSSTGTATKDHQSSTDGETNKVIEKAVAKYQLMFAQLITTVDPNGPGVQIVTVDLRKSATFSRKLLTQPRSPRR
jgi:hypothetical protein